MFLLPKVNMIIIRLKISLKNKRTILLSRINNVHILKIPIKEPIKIFIKGVFLFKRTDVEVNIRKSYTKLIRIIKSIYTFIASPIQVYIKQIKYIVKTTKKEDKTIFLVHDVLVVPQEVAPLEVFH